MNSALPERKNFTAAMRKRPYELFFFLASSFKPLVSYAIRKAVSVRRFNRLSPPRGKEYQQPEQKNTGGSKHCFLDRLPFMDFIAQTDKELQVIRLAGETLSITNNIEWAYAYTDIEDSFALNRFGWLLSALIEHPSVKTAENTLIWIEEWLKTMHTKKDHPAWESYSIAERLSNWPLILQITRRLVPIPDCLMAEVERSMLSQLEHLLCHIEDMGSFTNNHILNNARGLYIYGILASHKTATEKAREIFYKWTVRLFHEDGMLKEHSSHYQQLLLQRYEQVAFLALHAGDMEFYDFMYSWARLMAEARNFFLVLSPGTTIGLPIIGDISPDFDPGWLIPGSDRGWPKLKKWLKSEKHEQNAHIKKNGLTVKKGGFFRYDLDAVTIFWHIETDGMTYLSHGHYDLGGFILFYNGSEVFADPGRFTYTDSGSYGKSASMHSTILIDSLGAYCEDVRLNTLRAYRFQTASFDLSAADGYFNIEITSNGFKRLSTPVLWKRKFHVEKTGILISDVLESSGRNQVEARFQLAPGVKTTNGEGGLKISIDTGVDMHLKVKDQHAYKYSLFHGKNSNNNEGWFSKKYGERSPGTTVIFQRELTKQQTHTYEIRWK